MKFDQLIIVHYRKGRIGALVYVKRIPLVFIFVISLVIVSACNLEEKANSVPNTNANEQNDGESWATENKLDETEPVDELYEKAKEEGSVVIYAKSSRFKDVKTSFEAEYPGITVEPYKISGPDIVQKLVREHNAGVYNSDVVFTSVEEQLMDEGYLHTYKPSDILENYVDSYTEGSSLINIVDIKPVFYNTEAFEEAPVSGWWDLTEPEWKGKVLINDPITDVSFSETFLAIIENSDEMAQAYKDKYGEEIELTEENAGYEFVKRFIENDPVVISSGEDIVESIGQSGNESTHIGIAPSSKLRHVEQNNVPISAVFDLEPKISAIGTSAMYIADQAPHPNAAKLLIRWTMGEADGKSAGLEPFNKLGSWIPRDDIENPNPISIEEINAWHIDAEFYEKNYTTFRDFWLSNIN